MSATSEKRAQEGSRRVAKWIAAKPRRTWCTAFVLLVLLGGSWALANPLYSGPDEPAHVIKAAAVVRGQILGTQHSTEGDSKLLYVTIPGVYFSDNTGCFAFKADVPATCQKFDDNAPVGETVTSSGRYPPLYFLFVGLGSLLLPSSSGIFLMRIMGVVLFAGVIASALLSLRLLRDARVAGLGLALAVTPMVLFVAGIVNPSTPEIAGAIGAWASGYVLVTQAQARIETRVLVRFGISASILALGRPLGPMWLFLMVVVLAGVAKREDLAALVRSGRTRVCAAMVGAATIGQVLWLRIASPLGGIDPVRAMDKPFPTLFRQAIGNAYGNELQMVGDFGWLDTVAPQATYVFWLALVAFAVMLGLATTRRLPALALGGVIAMVVLVPALLDSMEAPKLGFIWQGRYTLPIGVGVPLLACCLASTDRTRRLLGGTRFYIVSAGLLFVAQNAAFYQSLRRNAVGEGGALKFWSFAQWSPPVPSFVLLVVFSLAAAGLLWLLLGPTDSAERDSGPAASS